MVMALMEPEESSYGVVLYPFDRQEDSDSCSVNVGDTLDVIRTVGDWHLVKSISKDGIRRKGLVPASYVKLYPAKKIKLGGRTSYMPELAKYIQEITLVLQQWHDIFKHYFTSLELGQESLELKVLISELHTLRQKFFLPTITVEDTKDLRKSVARVIDRGNSLTHLDIVVRDESGERLDPRTTSTVRMLREHRLATKRQIVVGSEKINEKIGATSHSLMVTIEKLSIRVVEESEIRLFLYDAKPDDEGPFTESFQITLLKPPQTIRTPIHILFTDLSKSDLNRQKVYLVAYVFRVGSMEWKESDSRKEGSSANSNKVTRCVRRPWGVSAKDVTHLFTSHNGSNLKKTDDISSMPYMSVSEGETLEGALNKLNQGKSDSSGSSGLVVRLSLYSTARMDDDDLKLLGNPTRTPKMGFPDVIFPHDTRNDLYVTLCRGEFHRGSKTSDKNVEVTVSVHNQSGTILSRPEAAPDRGVLQAGSGCPTTDRYRSVVYYHSDKPKWNEVFKVILPARIEEFTTAHIKFTFQHRSSSDSKDKLEKPFALAYIPLRHERGTALKDGKYDLIVYKVDAKQYKESDIQYLSLAWTRTPNWFKEPKNTVQGLSFSSKDIFQIKTVLCSTKFTQDENLLKLLQWNPRPDLEHAEYEPEEVSTRDIVEKVRSVDGAEIVRFLLNVFDALFRILVEADDETHYGRATGSFNEGNGSRARSVFNALVYILTLISDHKYQSFRPVVSLYIEGELFATLAYKKLIEEMHRAIETAPANEVLQIMKTIDFLFRFIVRSFQISHDHISVSLTMNERISNDHQTQEFEGLVKKLIVSMRDLFRKNDNVTAQGGCLKHISSIIKSLITVFPKLQLSQLLVELLSVVPQNFTKQKLTTISEIVHSDLFTDPDCRYTFLPMITNSVASHLPAEEDMRRRSCETGPVLGSKAFRILGMDPTPAENPLHTDETVQCVELLGDVMDILFQQEKVADHITHIMLGLVKRLIYSIGTVSDKDPLAMDLVVIFLALFRQMTETHHTILVNFIKTSNNSNNNRNNKNDEIYAFVNEILVILKNLVDKSYFPDDWSDMKFLQNSIILNTLEHFARTIRNEFSKPFQEQPWSNFFKCTVSFLTQDTFQVESMHDSKRIHLSNYYGDMRIKAADLIRTMWFSLGETTRMRFVPSEVETFLDMTFVPVELLRENTIPIFFDMMRCEYDSEQPRKSFQRMEEELIKKIVEGVEGGKGDSHYRDTFHSVMTRMCEEDNSGLRENGLVMVNTITTLLNYLLEYRGVQNEDDPGNRMSCIVSILEFSKEIRRDVLYLRYLYKLYDLHINSKNYSEAAFVLKMHSDQLNWSHDKVPEHLKSTKLHTHISTHRFLKEALYYDIINLLNLAKMWVCALDVCEELRFQYVKTYSRHIPKLYRDMADFMDKLFDEPRFEPEYFRVAFYGMGFPSFLQNEVFIYRGAAYEKLADFEGKILERFPQAELLRILDAPSEEVKMSSKQYLLICKVEPVIPESKRHSGSKYGDQTLRRYFQSKNIDCFTYSRPFHAEPRDTKNEFATLWQDRFTLQTAQPFPGIMSWFRVTHTKREQVRPIDNALESLQKLNDELRELVILQYIDEKEGLKNFTMKLMGTLDPAVNGGIEKFESAFLTPEYREKNPSHSYLVDELIGLIAAQVEILNKCLKIHEKKASKDLAPLQKRFVELYIALKKHVEDTYLVNTEDFKDMDFEHEIERAIRKYEKRVVTTPSAPKELVARQSNVLGRTVGSFSSTTTLYQNASKSRNQLAMGYKATLSRLSGQNSFGGSMEGDFSGLVATSPCATLPRHSSNSIGAPLFPKANNHNFFESDNNTLELNKRPLPLIPLTQTLVSQRPPRLQALESRKSQSWNTNGDSPSYNSDRNSVHSLNFDSNEEAPPLPPKQHPPKGDVKPPTPPPKKPPLHQPQE